MLSDQLPQAAFGSLPWPSTSSPICLTDAGLVIGPGTILAHMRKGSGDAQHLGLADDKARLLALLSVAEGRPVMASRVLPPIQAAADHWRRGDKALANLRLVFADLPRVAGSSAADRLCLAEYLLDAGTPPADLMEELWPGSASNDLDKHNYNRDQPRVPAGTSGGGQWTFGSGGSPSVARPIVVAGKLPPLDESQKEYEERRRTGQTTFEEDGAEARPIDLIAPLPPGVGPGPYAGRSVPAGPSPRPNSSQTSQINAIGRDTGCHTCGTTEPGTGSGNFVGDHQPPTALNPPGGKQYYFPQCLACSRAQGGHVKRFKSSGE